MTYKFITTPRKISMPWFIELEKNNPKIHFDKQKTPSGQGDPL